MTIGAVVTLVCAATSGIGCVVAGLAGSAIVAWVAYDYNWRCWVEPRLSYNGNIQSSNRYWRC